MWNTGKFLEGADQPQDPQARWNVCSKPEPERMSGFPALQNFTSAPEVADSFLDAIIGPCGV